MSPSRGFLNPSPDDWSTLLAVTAFCSIALYNLVELNTIIFTTFKRKSGLYFWSFLISSNGVAPYAIGFLLKDLRLSPSVYIDLTLIVIGWVCLVTGQSFVLYSRLHLVMRDRGKLRLVLAMIITNAVICHVPATILVYGANSADPGRWVSPYKIYEKVQVTLFFVQETTLSGIYIYQTLALLRADGTLQTRAANKLLMNLVWINVLVILLDTAILGLEYANFYNVQTAIKGLVYSVKLKLEFTVLNGLIELTKVGGATRFDIAAERSMNSCYCAGGPHHARGDSGGIYDGTDPRSTTVDFETFNETMISRMRDCAKSEHAESAYEVRIFADANGEAAGEIVNSGDGIVVRTETEVSTTRVEDWDAAWPGLEALEAGSRPVTRGSKPDSRRQSSEVEFVKR
ncbi:putative Integral membrane protein [Seiridium unicorne]|uniref:Integral membrane protein n=1 Tax=Seiridium unicorne TaxID=138068 RepID=A0ABR2V8M9_9PEZI